MVRKAFRCEENKKPRHRVEAFEVFECFSSLCFLCSYDFIVFENQFFFWVQN